MKATAEQRDRIAKMIFADIYPHYLNRIVKNGRTKEELHRVITWFTGYDDQKIQSLMDEKVTFETFFSNAKIHKNADMIKGVVCGYRVEEIEFKLTQNSRRMEKLIDELARGRKMDKILRKPKE